MADAGLGNPMEELWRKRSSQEMYYTDASAVGLALFIGLLESFHRALPIAEAGIFLTVLKALLVAGMIFLGVCLHSFPHSLLHCPMPNFAPGEVDSKL